MNLHKNPWIINFDNYDLSQVGRRETLCVLGNGYFATRGAAEDIRADYIHYPGTYLAGGYNTLESTIADHILFNEDLVNLPNWLPLSVYQKNETFKAVSVNSKPCFYQLHLIMKTGTLFRSLQYINEQGNKFQVTSKRLVSMADPHLAAMQYHFTPLNFSGKFIVKSGLDGSVVNAGVPRYAQFNNKHLKVIACEKIANNLILMIVETINSNLQVVLAVQTSITSQGKLLAVQSATQINPNDISQKFSVAVNKNQTIVIEKIVSLYSSKDFAIKNLKSAALNAVLRAKKFNSIERKQRRAWSQLWETWDIKIGTTMEEQRLIRLNIFHLFQTLSANSIGCDYGAPARGLHGEAYRGHVFWDELFILPFYIKRLPEVARSLLLYRYRRLEAAKCLAQELGYQGARFPWQSASDGSEVSQQWHFNPCSSTWGPDYSSMQYHVNSAIVYNFWQYYLYTGDISFISTYGAVVILEIARFWASFVVFNSTKQRYEINAVMGPDEFHEKYPGAKRPGINNNAYTNVLAVWTLEKGLEVLNLLSSSRVAELKQLLDLKDTELNYWSDIIHNMFIPFHNGVISQFEGYENLKEFAWNDYKIKYGNIERLDRILKKEGDSPDNYKIAKQADVAMLFYLFSKKTLRRIFSKLGYNLNDQIEKKTIQYYLENTCHGSSLSKIVYSSVITEFHPHLARELYLQALNCDIDLQNLTTEEGIHLGVMSSTVDHILKHYVGLNVEDSLLSFMPNLPHYFTYLNIRIQYCFNQYFIQMDKKHFSITLESTSADQPIMINNHPAKLKYGIPLEYNLSHIIK